MDINFCLQCDNPLTYKSIGDEGEQKYCAACNKFYFDNPARQTFYIQQSDRFLCR